MTIKPSKTLLAASCTAAALLVAVLLPTACVKPNSVSCPSGLVCPEGTRCAAHQDTCITGNCGNGTVDPGEECDDGNVISGDGCSAACQLEGCGNGRIDVYKDGGPAEECDDGPLNGKDGKCQTTCLNVACGNGRIDSLPDGGTEQCDPGDAGQTATCNANCTFARCGDGILNPLFPVFPDGGTEQCDPGQVPTADCTQFCTISTCGDGITNPAAHEQCDDGENNGVDGICQSDCKQIACGNGEINTFPDGGTEQCDPGDAGETATCNVNCTTPRCGDGVPNVLAPVFPDGGGHQECNPGPVPTASCTQFCTNSSCGDGITNPAANEECDDGPLNGKDGVCQSNCDLIVCGNHRIDFFPDGGAEECDNGTPADGGTNGIDGLCSDTCQTAYCGNGRIDSRTDGGKEQCDDGTQNGQDGICDTYCLREFCGDGIVDVDRSEQCDFGAPFADGGGNQDGGGNGLNGVCNVGCAYERCGDGIVDSDRGEECDYGDSNGKNGICDVFCHKEICGDGIVDTDSREQCDFGMPFPDGGGNQDGGGNGAPGSSCSAQCQNASCGNGIVDSNLGEQCDDGVYNGGTLPDGGASKCSASCQNVACGDGVVEVNVGEQCDDGTHDSPTCNYGDGGMFLSCKLSRCGDSYVNVAAGEDCDPGDAGQTALCNANCTLSYCGDGYVNPQASEQCDPGQADSRFCNYAGGSAPQSCKVAFCGDGYVNAAAGEACDPGDAGETAGCNANCKVAACGDGFVNPLHCNFLPDGGGGCEQCDTFGVDNSYCVGGTCQATRCGDGHTNTVAGEQCDDGNSSNDDSCTNACLSNVCGDGYVNKALGADGGPIERCDVGNLYGDAGCAGKEPDGGLTGACLPLNGWTCTGEGQGSCKTTCGDGVVAGSEQCDDGNTNNNDGCSSGCVLEPGFSCQNPSDGGKTVCGSICGDGVIELGETCDQGTLPDGGVRNFGDAGCDTTCQVQTGWTCTGTGPNSCQPICGDGRKVGGETCDMGPLPDGGLSNFGDAGCDTSCHVETGWSCTGTGSGSCATTCGDGIVAGQEQCDDYNNTGCGSCLSGCTGAQSSVKAQGTWSMKNGNQINNGEWFKLDDGLGKAVTFELRNDANPASSGHVLIQVPNSGNNSTQVATDVINAINNQANQGNLGIHATSSSSSITATNDLAGAFGNVGILTSGNSTLQNLKGMHLGTGSDCAVDVGCASDSDCVPTLHCDTALHVCKSTVCGNGVVEGSEACDDGNNDACGTCSAGCTATQTPTAATGSLLVPSTVVGPVQGLEGATFTLDDGTTTKLFLLDDGSGDGGFPDGGAYVQVNIATAAANTDVASAIKTAVNGSGLNLTAALNGTVATEVDLTNTRATSLGNQPIVVSPSASSGACVSPGDGGSLFCSGGEACDGTNCQPLTENDLSGGVAGDCASGLGCRSNADCASGTCRADGGCL